MKRAGLAAAAALAFVLGSASTPVVAAPCDVFTDVQDTDNFCNSVQWLKNRSITLGCTSATTYCPTDVVTRASMALFLNRLGVAVTPRLIGQQNVTSAQSLLAGQFFPYCNSVVLPAVNFPQTVRARGSISLPASGSQLSMFLVVSLNGAGFQNMNFQSAVVANPNGEQNLSWSSNTTAVPPGNSVQVAIGISNTGVGTLNLTPGRCAIEADLINANPTSPPFDE